jgi:hypothetical protein
LTSRAVSNRRNLAPFALIELEERRAEYVEKKQARENRLDTQNNQCWQSSFGRELKIPWPKGRAGSIPRHQ